MWWLLPALWLGGGVTAPAANQSPARRAQERPNIVYLLADDLGYRDVGFTGGTTIKTPHLDQLAAAGARLEQFYVQPVCSPTRAALLTGRYPMRYGLQVSVIRPWAQYGLPLDERTLPQALKEVGYATAFCGKWHLGHFAPEYLPTRRGFDHQYGHYNGMLDYFTHERDGGHDWHRDDRASYDEGYTTQLLADEAVKFIKQQTSGGQSAARPFFLYVPFNAPHAPHQVPERYKAPYANLPEPRRTVAGMVAAMDEAVGRIVAALEAAGLRGSTLILFSSDNGGPNPGRVSDNGLLRAGKGTVYEGGVRVPACAVWDGRIKPGTTINHPIHITDWYPTLLKLAGASLKQKLPLDGFDLWPTLRAGKPSRRGEILHNTTPQGGALRVGDWKLVVNGAALREGGPDEEAPASVAPQSAPQTVELFNLAQDPYEKNNLAAQHPDKVKQLRARYDALAGTAAAPKYETKPPGFKSPKVWGARR